METKRINALSGWMGGKRKVVIPLLNAIDAFTPEAGVVRCYGSAFVGMGWVTLSIRRHEMEYINDINHLLITLFHVVKTRPGDLIDSFKYIPIAQDVFNSYRTKVKTNTFDGELDIAHTYLYLLLVGYGCKASDFSYFISPQRGSSFNHDTIEKKIEDVWSRFKNIGISCMPYDKFIKFIDSPHTVFFFDPPYYGTTQYEKETTWSDGDYLYFKAICDDISGGFVLTVNSNEFINNLFKDYHIYSHGVRYSMVSGADKDATSELIITNYKIHDTYLKNMYEHKPTANTTITTPVQVTLF